jgi:hypothetical protein
MRGLVPLCVGLVAASCVHEDGKQAPTQPNVSAIVTAYAQPTAALTQENAPLVVAALVQTLEDLQQALTVFGAMQDVFAAFEGSTDSRGDGLAVRRQALSAGFDGWARVEYVCPGLAPEIVDRRQGVIEAFAFVTQGGLRPPMWGNARDCALPDSGEAVRFDGDLIYEVESGLLSFTGTLARAAERVVPFRLEVMLRDGMIRHRVVLPDGHLILAWDYDAGPESLTVETLDGDWTCRVQLQGRAAGQCSHPRLGQVTF